MWSGITKIRWPIKWRLVTFSATGLILILFLFHLFFYHIAKEWFLKSEKAILAGKLQAIVELLQQNSSLRQDLSWLTTLVEKEQAILIVNEAGKKTIFNQGIPNSWFTSTPPEGNGLVVMKNLPYGGKVFFYSTYHMVEDRLSFLMTVLIIASFLLLILVSIGGYWMSTIAFRPIQKIMKEVQELNPAHDDHRLAIPNTGDEIAELSKVLNHQLDQIYHTLQKQSRFVSDASHELRTPIAVIRGYMDLLRRWGLKKPEIAQEALETMDQELTRVEKMTKQLLQLAHLEQDAASTKDLEKLEAFSLNRLIEKRVQRWKRVWADKKFDANLPTSHLLIHGQKADWEELLDILLDNAGKYTPSGGIIEVSLRLQKQEICLVVSDTGFGISKEEIPHLFERFYRAKKNRSSKHLAGSGLGLAIAKQLVEKYQGRIEVDSQVKKGTSIRIFFPDSNLILI